SARHLSFVETGRSRPTREMILRLASRLDVPLRGQNRLLLAGRDSPAGAATGLGGKARCAGAAPLRDSVAGPAPYPVGAGGRRWTMVAATEAAGRFLEGCAAWLREPPVNVLRLSLHPEGMAPRIRNLAEWRTHVLHRLDQQAAHTADPVLRELHAELAGYPG